MTPILGVSPPGAPPGMESDSRIPTLGASNPTSRATLSGPHNAEQGNSNGIGRSAAGVGRSVLIKQDS
jgi:hypothetical protein